MREELKFPNEGNPWELPLNAVPIPEALADLSFLPPLHLEELEPIEDLQGLALHVALLTGTVRQQQARIAELEGREGWLRKLLRPK